MSMNRARKGEPLVALALLIGIWVMARAAMWETPPALPLIAFNQSAPVAAPRMVATVETPAAAPSAAEVITWPSEDRRPAPSLLRKPQVPEPAPPSFAPSAPSLPAVTPTTPRLAAGHGLLYMAALAQLPLLVSPPDRYTAPATTLPFTPRAIATGQRRWSADSWLLLRRGRTTNAIAGFVPPAYGASQGGTVLRYRLAPGNAHRPTLYLRATSAVERPRGEEIALGFALRPFPRVPVAALAEARATRSSSGTIYRPAAMAVSELAPLKLPLGARAEAYGQAGYVGGRDATFFADGQLLVSRRVLTLGPAELRAGGGAWAGAQKGASRVDVGPSASLGFQIGPANARIEADWRFRVGGIATPSSGPALTLSAGF